MLGAKHVEAPYIAIGQIATFIYFAYFFLLVPASSLLEYILSKGIFPTAQQGSKIAAFPGSSNLKSSPSSSTKRTYSTSASQAPLNEAENTELVEAQKDLKNLLLATPTCLRQG